MKKLAILSILSTGICHGDIIAPEELINHPVVIIEEEITEEVHQPIAPREQQPVEESNTEGDADSSPEASSDENSNNLTTESASSDTEDQSQEIDNSSNTEGDADSSPEASSDDSSNNLTTESASSDTEDQSQEINNSSNTEEEVDSSPEASSDENSNNLTTESASSDTEDQSQEIDNPSNTEEEVDSSPEASSDDSSNNLTTESASSDTEDQSQEIDNSSNTEGDADSSPEASSDENSNNLTTESASSNTEDQSQEIDNSSNTGGDADSTDTSEGDESSPNSVVNNDDASQESSIEETDNSSPPSTQEEEANSSTDTSESDESSPNSVVNNDDASQESSIEETDNSSPPSTQEEEANSSTDTSESDESSPNSVVNNDDTRETDIPEIIPVIIEDSSPPPTETTITESTSSTEASWKGKRCTVKTTQLEEGSKIEVTDEHGYLILLFELKEGILHLKEIFPTDEISADDAVNLANELQRLLGKETMYADDHLLSLVCPRDKKWCWNEPPYFLRLQRILTDGEGFYESHGGQALHPDYEKAKQFVRDFRMWDWFNVSKPYLSTLPETKHSYEIIEKAWKRLGRNPLATMSDFAERAKNAFEKTGLDHQIWHEFNNRIIAHKEGWAGRFADSFLNHESASPTLKYLLACKTINRIKKIANLLTPEIDELADQIAAIEAMPIKEREATLLQAIENRIDKEAASSTKSPLQRLPRQIHIAFRKYQYIECKTPFASLYAACLAATQAFPEETDKTALYREALVQYQNYQLTKFERYALWNISLGIIKESSLFVFEPPSSSN